jgi:hypothetical protein
VFTDCYRFKTKPQYHILPTALKILTDSQRNVKSFRNKLSEVYIVPLNWNRDSSGSIVSDYGLDDRANGVRSPAGAKDFSSILCVQTGSEAHPASCPVGTGGPFPGGKARQGRNADHSPPSSAEVVKE